MQKIDWNRVYRKQSGVLIGVAYRYVKERKQAEDLVQDALIAAIQNAEHFSGKGAFEAWLRKIVVNECLMHLRKAKLETETWDENEHLLLDEPQTPEEDEPDYADDPDKRRVIERCNFSREDLLEIATCLPEHHRLVFNMYVMDGFSHREIAAKLNISEGTSKSHLNRARKKLQDLLYEKALDMQKKKKKRLLVAVWFGAMTGKSSVVDAMHRKVFADFRMMAPPPSMGLEQAILSAPTASVGLSATAVTLVAVAAAACGAAGTLGVVEWQKQRAEQPSTSIEYPMPEVEITNEAVFDLDFPASADIPSADAEPVLTKPTPSNPAPQEALPIEQDTVTPAKTPVIIRRIIFDTIYED